MTLEELKAKYTVAYRIISKERAKANGDYAGELEKLLVILDDMKDELKWRIPMMDDVPMGFDQPTLLEVVGKAVYP